MPCDHCYYLIIYFAMSSHSNTFFCATATSSSTAAKPPRLPNCMINETLRLTIAVDEPSVMLKYNKTRIHQLADYEGIVIDALTELSSLCNFTYTVIPANEDEPFGILDDNGDWNGLIGRLLKNETDIIGMMTVSHERAQVVDFTASIFFDSLGVLMLKPRAASPSTFIFLTPLTWRVWLSCLVAVLVFALSLWLIAGIVYQATPSQNSSKVFTKLDSLWYIITCFLAQGERLEPRRLSICILCATWWSFTLILIACYTGNLTAFLTIAQRTTAISAIEDLVKQTEIEYGVIAGASTFSFFMNAEDDVYKKMAAYMRATPGVIATRDDAIRRVKTGRYALIGPSFMLKYVANQNCDLILIGSGTIGTSPTAFALQKGSAYREQLSDAILYMQANARFDTFKNKWFKRGASQHECEDKSDKNTVALDIINLGGLYIVTAAGLGVAFLVAFVERLTQTKSKEIKD